MGIEIESNVPMPDPVQGGGMVTKYPWPDMQDGDSFFIACSEEDHDKVYRRVTNSGKGWIERNRPGAAVIRGRRVEGGIRFWWFEVSDESA